GVQTCALPTSTSNKIPAVARGGIREQENHPRRAGGSRAKNPSPATRKRIREAKNPSPATRGREREGASLHRLEHRRPRTNSRGIRICFAQVEIVPALNTGSRRVGHVVRHDELVRVVVRP